MASSDAGREIRERARHQVRHDALPRCLAAIEEFVACVHAHESGTLRCEVRQGHDDPTRYIHLFIFRDDAAQRRHSGSAEVRRFAPVLCPECVAPVEFIGCREIASNQP